MRDFGNIIFRTDIKAYITEDGCMIPSPDDTTVPDFIHSQYNDLYHELEQYAKEHPEKVTNKDSSLTPEEEEYLAKIEADSIIMNKVKKSYAQTSAFSYAEFAVMVKAKLFESWKAGEKYSAGYRLEHKGIVYEVVQEVTAIENQPPDAVGMLAIYRPLSVDSETGTEPDGTKENPYTYFHGMDVKKDCYYTFDGKLWLAKADMPACVWNPGTAGLWQWEEVKG